MTEVINEIPARLRNVSMNGHVAGAADIIDDYTGETLDKLSVKPATTGTAGDYPYNGLGRVILKKNMVNGVNTLTQDMMPLEAGENIVYVIQYDFMIGEDVTIPNNCTLEFKGGSISGNHMLTMNNCFIDGEAKFDVQAFSGSIRNGSFNVLWLDDSDFGDKMNKAAQYFESLYVPAIDISFSTPIDITVGKELDCRASLTYTGVITNNEAAIKIYGFYSKIYIKYIGMPGGTSPTGIDFSKTRTKNFIGVLIWNSNCLDIHIGMISGFNEGVRLAGIGAGCVDGKLHIQTMWNYNFGVRLFTGKRDSDEKDGWCNGWDISGNTWRSMGNTIEEKHAICLAGALYGDDSYRDTSLTNPTNNGTSRVNIHDIDFENHSYPIYIGGTHNHLQITNCREEGITGLFFCPDGSTFQVKALKYLPGYKNSVDGSYFKNCGGISMLLPIRDRYEYEFGTNSKRLIKATYANTFTQGSVWMYSIYAKELTTITSYASGLYHGVIFPVTSSLNIYLEIIGKSIPFAAVFLDDNYNNVSEAVNEVTGNINGGFYYQPQYKMFRSGNGTKHNIPIPKIAGATHVFIGIGAQTFPCAKVIYHSDVSPVQKDIPSSGTTEERPGTPDVMFKYFDTTLNKPICYIGEWIDSTGATV